MQTFAGVPVHDGAHIVLMPSFACSLHELREKLKGASIRISARSTLILEGSNVLINKLDLDGALVVRAAPGMHFKQRYLWHPVSLTVFFFPCGLLHFSVSSLRLFGRYSGAEVRLDSVSVKNAGWNFQEIDTTDAKIAEKYAVFFCNIDANIGNYQYSHFFTVLFCSHPLRHLRLRIRGYDIVRAEEKVIEFAEAGVFTVNESQ